MAKMCEVCGKTMSTGHNVSKAHNLTKRKWYPNLQNIKVDVDGKAKRMKVCTSCIQKGKVKKFV